MSNPLRPSRDTLTEQMPSSYIWDANWHKRVNRSYSLDESNKFWANLGLELQAGVPLPAYLQIGDGVSEMKETLASAQQGGLQLFRRSGGAYALANSMWSTLPRGSGMYYDRDLVEAAVTDKFLATGGTQFARGRFVKYYKQNLNKRGHRPFDAVEVAKAMLDCGVSISTQDIEPLPIIQKEPGGKAVRVSLNSDNGFPVGGKGTTPGAMDMCVRLAEEVRNELEAIEGDTNDARAAAVAEEIWRWYRHKPWLVALKGKLKMDHYSRAKLENQEMRFYNCVPRHLALLMQQATQAFEAHCHGCFDEVAPARHSAQKLTLVRGGAHELIKRMQAQLDEVPLGQPAFAYYHCGDDSKVAVRTASGKIVIFALDCSAFDLTQNGKVTEKVHLQFRKKLAEIDPVSAGIWYALMRKRLVVIENSTTVILEHGGASGMPMQSKVNDVLMDGLIKRVIAEWVDAHATDPQKVNDLFQRVGGKTGFVVKLEQYYCTPETGLTLFEVLRHRPFIFVGYSLQTSPAGYVYPILDLPRTMSQMVYPGGKYKVSDREFKRTEAVRLASIALGSGIPVGEQTAFHETMVQGAVRLLTEEVNNMDNPDMESDLFVGAAQLSAQVMGEEDAVLMTKSMRGLLNFLDNGKGIIHLFAHPADPTYKFVGEREMEPSTSQTVALGWTPDLLFPATVAAAEEEDEAKPLVREQLPRFRNRLAQELQTLAETGVIRELLRTLRDDPKTYGRMPRQKTETAEQQFKRVGAEHRENARMDREFLAGYADEAGLRSEDVREKKAARSRAQQHNAKQGSVAAARSVLNNAPSDPYTDKDSRHAKSRKGKARRHK